MIGTDHRRDGEPHRHVADHRRRPVALVAVADDRPAQHDADAAAEALQDARAAISTPIDCAGRAEDAGDDEHGQPGKQHRPPPRGGPKADRAQAARPPLRTGRRKEPAGSSPGSVSRPRMMSGIAGTNMLIAIGLSAETTIRRTIRSRGEADQTGAGIIRSMSLSATIRAIRRSRWMV